MIKIYQGDTYQEDYQVSVDNVTQNIEDYELYFAVGNSALDLSSSSPTYIISPISSTLIDPQTRQISISSLITSDIPTGSYVYEVQVVDGAGSVLTVEQDKFTVLPQIIQL